MLGSLSVYNAKQKFYNSGINQYCT